MTTALSDTTLGCAVFSDSRIDLIGRSIFLPGGSIAHWFDHVRIKSVMKGYTHLISRESRYNAY
jgi:hypothetical protein